MKAYIDKSALVAEIEKYISNYKGILNKVDKSSYNWLDSIMSLESKIDVLQHILSFINTLEVKEINNVWHDTRRTIPEDGSEQIICIKEDGLAVSTVGKIVNGTIKWAYLGDLLNINSFNVEVKEVDLDYIKKELDEAVRIYKPNGDFGWGTLYNVATHFFELGLKVQKGE